MIYFRLAETFARFRAKFENGKENAGKNYGQELAAFTEAAKKLVKEREEIKTKQRVLDSLQRCASDILSCKKKEEVIDVNVTKVENDSNDDKSSHIVNVEMSSETATGQSKNARRAAKKRAKKKQMKIKALLEQSPADVSQQMTITESKSRSITINEVSMPKTDTITWKNLSNAEKLLGITMAESAANALNTKGKILFLEKIQFTHMNISLHTELSPKKSEKITDFIKYRCVHCQDVNHWIETFNAPKDVYAHWLSCHTEPPNTKQFRYFMVEYAACYYCKMTGTYHELIKHHKNSHLSDQFVIVNQNDVKKCALCTYSGLGMIEHFHTMHKLVLKTLSRRNLRSVYTPLQLSDTMLNELLESKVHIRQICGYCKMDFETERDIRHHHNTIHTTQKMLIKEIYTNYIVQLICGVCHIKVDRSLFLRHIETHARDWMCHKCNFTTIDMCQMANHDQTHKSGDTFKHRCIQLRNRLKRVFLKTEMFFGNGIVLTKQNLLNTKYDDSKHFDDFLDALLVVKENRYIRRDFIKIESKCSNLDFPE